MKKEPFKSKEELDKMSREEIAEHRYQVIVNKEGNDWHDSEEKRYIDELEYYEHLRFKDKVLEQYKRWSTLDKTPEDKLIASIFTTIEPESMYSLQTNLKLKELGEFRYITGIE